jgi:hypothetical protein
MANTKDFNRPIGVTVTLTPNALTLLLYALRSIVVQQWWLAGHLLIQVFLPGPRDWDSGLVILEPRNDMLNLDRAFVCADYGLSCLANATVKQLFACREPYRRIWITPQPLQFLNSFRTFL